MPDAAARYRARHPEAEIGDAQAEERQQRAEFKDEHRSLRRTSRTRGIVVPRDAWERVFGSGASTTTED